MVRLEAKVRSLMSTKTSDTAEGLATSINVACETAVSGLEMLPDHISKRGNLAKLAAIMDARELTFPVVVVHVMVQRPV